ncbi:uncharacterized protein LOC121386756 [Gigantopelta aegis]|uniref:uncharacterized protein LOC121386756 n=1 Tax=Gigantopelta aegis TaxID=1735272 RepID=UPI001B88C0A1|nr:uncharacterized protein LOC121386756 [Gigantopelta aegis]
MNWTLVLLVFVVWSTFHVFAVEVLELSTNLSSTEYGRTFTLVCTVKGENRADEAITFVRNNKTICKRRAYKSNIQTKPFECAIYYNTTQEYQCECDAIHANTKIYSVTIKSFTAIVEAHWVCSSVSVNDNILLTSNVVYLNYVNHSANRTTPYSENVTTISSTSTTSELADDSRSNPVLIPAVSAACGAVIVLVVIVVAVYIIKKRINSRQYGPMDNKNIGHNYAEQNNTQGRKEPVMEDNELYFMSKDSPKRRRKPVMIDNDIYTLGNGDEELHDKPEDVGDMYSVVNKHGKTKGDPLQKLTDEEISAMYAVVKKDTKSVADNKGKDMRTNEKREDNELAEDMSDMYTQVNKNKMKNKK